MLLTRKSTTVSGASASALVSSLSRGLGRAIPTMDRRAFLRRSGLGVGAGMAASQLVLVKKAQAADSCQRRCRWKERCRQAHGLRPLLGRLRDRRGGRERHLGAPGAGVRFADQPRRALRQGCRGARERPRRVPPEGPDEAGGRQVPEDRLGPGLERDQRQDARAAQAERPRFDLRRRLVQAQQRAGLPAAQVDEPVGQQQLRPPGAHLPFDDRRRCGQHLGLRRDDEFVQRHAEQPGGDVHRQQCGRSAPGVDAAHAARQGKRLQDDRRRPALHAHGGQGG